MTMTLIETKTLASSATSIEFVSIPQDSTDLLLTYSLRTDRSSTNDYIVLAFNTSTANFSVKNLWGYSPSGVLTNSTLTNNTSVPSATNTSNTFGSGQLYIPNYAGSTNKSFSMDSVYQGSGESGAIISAGLWSQTAAITSIKFSPYLGTNFVTGSTMSLYKILKGSGGATVS